MDRNPKVGMIPGKILIFVTGGTAAATTAAAT
jgi:hypothetical protein